MPEEEIEQREGTEPKPPDGPDSGSAPRPGRRYFTRRNTVISGGLLAILIVILVALSFVFYRYGVFDTYVRSQFVAKMDRIGIVFDADVFRVTVNPLALELKNATFNDKVTGEKLFFIREAHLGLTVENLYAWQLTRDITVDTTDISGAEVWVKFDENGRSNFANLVEDQTGSRVNFKYDSVRFNLSDSVVHFGDLSRRITADANNLQFRLAPLDNASPDDPQKRYTVDLSATDSNFAYDGNPVQDIDVRAKAIVDANGADIQELKIDTPLGTSLMSGTVTDWKRFKYDLNVESTVDLTQASTIFPLGMPIKGIGNFKGWVSGEGETYRVDGTADSESLTADGIYLRAANVTATVEGTNTNYSANGRAVAELLTFEDFRIDFPKIAGNVRGTGTDFRWVGDLEAGAAKTKSLTLGGLFLADAVAEYKDRQLAGSAGSARIQKFSAANIEFDQLRANAVKFARNEGTTRITAGGTQADRFHSKDYEIRGLQGRNLNVTDREGRTDLRLDDLRAPSASIKGSKVTGLKADELAFTDLPSSTDIDLNGVTADRVDSNGTVIRGLSAPEIAIHDTKPETIVYSDSLRVASIDSESATLGSLNIAGVRLTIRQGRVEGRSADIDAGTVALKKTETVAGGGRLENVKLARPVFVLEPSGRYRVTADMSLGGGIVGSIPLGAGRAAVVVSNGRAELNGLTAQVMNGSLNGNAVIAFSGGGRSTINAGFSGLDLSKLVAIQSGRVIPLEGEAAGRVDLSFNGTDYRTITGTINADIAARAGDAANAIPVSGRVELTATNGLFNVDVGRLNTQKSELTANGRFDLRGDDSNLDITLRSSDAGEIERLFRVTGIAPDVEQQLDSMEVALAGDLSFNGKLTGNATDPTVNGNLTLASLAMRGRELGSLTSEVAVSPLGFDLRNGNLRAADGGTVAFSVNAPRGGANNTSVQATLTDVNAGNLLAALPVTLPERLRDFTGRTSGTVNLTGLPNAASGEINIAAASGTLAGQAFDNLNVKAVFAGTVVTLERAEIRVGSGSVAATGTYDRASTEFNLDVNGNGVPLPLALSFLPKSDAIPTITGVTDFTAKATGIWDRPATYNINFNGSGRDVVVNDNPFGAVTFKGVTANQVLNADLTAMLEGRPQIVTATVNFGEERMPFRVEHTLDQSPLGPFFALVPQLRGISIGGTGTGHVEFGGDLATRDANGNLVLTTANLTGTARFDQLSLLIEDTPLVASEPVVVRFSPREITFESARFSGGGSNVTIAGTKAITDDGMNDLSVDGRINLALLNVFPAVAASDAIFGGFADISMRLVGINRTARLSGTATLANAAVATFIGSDRLTFERLQGRIIFTSNQAQIAEMKGYLGGGEFTASGGALIGDGLEIQAFRLALNGKNVTVPLPQDFMTTGDAELEITGRRIGGGELSTLIAGNIRARRSMYTKDIDLANVVGARREGSLSGGASSLSAPRFDLTIEGRDALIVRNNIADLTASVSLRLTGTTDSPQISGRISANSGTVFFRKDRYVVQRGVLEFPPNTDIEPIINLQAETEINGYQIFVNLSGPLTDTEQLVASVRSSPALPQADVISLITTGNLANTESGIPTLAQSGINTAAEVLTDAIINNPARKATDKLFGLNVFEIDPIIAGQRINPGARLTVGRQINNNLRVTYATNLSQDQNQVLALEYRVSNKLSFVAQYEQRSLSNVTRNRDNFSFEIRFRRRF